MTLIPSIIGMVGAAMILAAYLLLQIGKMTTEGLWYTVVNLVGSLLILFSLYFDFNLPALFIEVVWITVSVIALIRLYRKRAAGRDQRTSSSLPSQIAPGTARHCHIRQPGLRTLGVTTTPPGIASPQMSRSPQNPRSFASGSVPFVLTIRH